jgi:DNA-binding CsgD family transcriptional regulator
LEAGAVDDALTLLGTVDAGALDELERARVDLLRAQIAFVSSRGSDASPLLLEAARRLEPLDVALSRQTYRDTLCAAMLAGRLATAGGSSLEVARAASATPAPQQQPRAPDLLLDGLATLFCEGYAPAVPILREAQGAFGTDMSAAEQLRWLWLAASSAVHLWDDGCWETLSQRHVQLAREAGALGELPLALSQRAYVHLFSGELTAATSLAAEIDASMAATGTNLTPYAAVGLAALRGREPEAASLIDVSRAEVTQRGEGIGITVLDWAEAVLSNGLGRYEDACAAALRVVEHPQDLGVSNWGMVELVEAAIRCGDHELAGRAHHLLAERALPSGTEWALGVYARSRALVSDGDAVDSLYREAIERLKRTRFRVDLARSHLVYGEWLRRERRRADAREQLNTALVLFTSMGTEAFAERTRRELLASGERIARRDVETRDELTPQELQIAGLARDGGSNAAIGARLFISQHTVAYHLRKVFSKLDITSRNQLGQVLPDYQPTSPVSSALRSSC